ncbi:MAG: HAD-IIIA family hydrolase [Bacteroidales bacterium]|jgi:D-glycero-D-manno-heptose 1,7-bisphosphate phosphatase|nr:HAD-IIIA family hydrolase [Bacteroidales bacterium]
MIKAISLRQSDFMMKIDTSWSLFLDRDGVINERIIGGYIQEVSSFRFLDNVPEAIAILRKIFGHIFIVTNQQGIGKGMMTVDDLYHIHDYMEFQLSVKFDKIYYSPFLAEENNMMRKPNPGMAIQAKKDFPKIDFSKSVMVGDSISDILFGKSVEMKTVYISSEKKNVEADLICPSLYDFAKVILVEQKYFPDSKTDMKC